MVTTGSGDSTDRHVVTSSAPGQRVTSDDDAPDLISAAALIG
jgi:hypothetical protein